jgi:pimeloyl-ACP methyl ester carboxylesterase
MASVFAWIFVFVAFFLLLVLLLAAAGISNLLFHPPRQPLTRTPLDGGLVYEEVAFQSRDLLTLKGWFIPTLEKNSRRAVILLHPMFANRAGTLRGTGQSADPIPFYRSGLPRAPDLLRTAAAFHQAGYDVLLFDFRCHGESQAGRCAGGMSEDQDVIAALDYILSRLRGTPEEPFPAVGMVGFGMGAAAAIAAIGRLKGSERSFKVFSGDNEGATGYTEFEPPNVKRLSFLVAIQPTRLGRVLRASLSRISPPLAVVLYPLVEWLVQKQGAYPLETDLLQKYASEVTVPLLFIHSCSKQRGGYDEARRLYEAVPAHKTAWWIEASLEQEDLFRYVNEHLTPVLAFASGCVEEFLRGVNISAPR